MIDMTQFDLKDEVIKGLRQLLPNQGNNPHRVLNAYPTKPNLLPCISVTQASGSLGPETIGEQWTTPEYVEDPETGEQFAIRGTFYRQGVEVTVWSHNANDRDTYKREVRFALWRLRRTLSTLKDFQQSTLTEQGDSQDFDSQAPTDIFMFTFELAGLCPLKEFTPLPPVDRVEVSGFWDNSVLEEDE